MGLAEPRKRLKISHDPNNLVWSQSAESYGQKLLSSQGWKPGQGLGARDAKHFNSSPFPKLAVSYKDDTLGLGASVKSQDLVHTRTGLDAFQGLLGRLNGKSDVELEKETQKNRNRELAMWAQGRWGGVMFVPGGTLVQGDGYRKVEEETQRNIESQHISESQSNETKVTEKAQRRAEKMRQKEERKPKREAKLGDKTVSTASETPGRKAQSAPPASGLLQKNASEKKSLSREKKQKKKKKRKTPNLSPGRNDHLDADKEKEILLAPSSTPIPREGPVVARPSAPLPLTGRHVIRGRDIEAKRMVFSDMRMLDQIFMAKG